MSQALKEWASTVSPPVDDWLCDPEYEQWADDYDRRTAETRGNEDMKMDDIYKSADSNFLKAGDLKGKGVKLVISAIGVQEFDEKASDGRPYKAAKAILSFEGTPKQLVTNKTNANILKDMYGDELDLWVGQEVKLITKMVEYNKKDVPAIRVYQEVAEEEFQDFTQKAEGLDDDIPF